MRRTRIESGDAHTVLTHARLGSVGDQESDKDEFDEISHYREWDLEPVFENRVETVASVAVRRTQTQSAK
jgi:hypothetical protein